MKRLGVIAGVIGLSYLLTACDRRPEESNSQAGAPPAPSPAALSASAADAAKKRQEKLTKVKQGLEMLPPAAYLYPKTGVTIGQGWDTYNEVGTTASCVEAAAVPLETTSFKTDVRQAQSSVSTLTEQTLAVRASYSGTGGKASGSVSRESSKSLNVDALNFAFTFEAENGSTFAAPLGVFDQVIVEPLRLGKEFRPSAADLSPAKPQVAPASPVALSREIQFTPVAKKMLDDKQYDKFASVCGQGFVSAIHRGARVDIVLTMASSKAEDRDALTSAMSASGYGASGSVKLTTNNRKTVTNSNVGYRTSQMGGLPHIPQAIKQDGVLDITSLAPSASNMLSNPTAYRVMVVPYENLDPSIRGELTTPLRMLSLGSYYMALKDVYNLVDSIVENNRRRFKEGKDEPKPYISATALQAYGGEGKLIELKDLIQIDMAVLEYALSECAAKKTTCLVADSFDNIRQQLEDDRKDIESALTTVGTAKASPEDKLRALIANTASVTVMSSRLNLPDSKGLAELLPNVYVETASKAVSAYLTGPPTKDGPEELARRAITLKYRELLQKQEEVFQRFKDSVEQLQREIAAIDAENSLPATFYLRFYWYLSQIPPPHSAEADYYVKEDFEIANGATAGEIVSKAMRARELIVRAAMNTRMLPWKRYFCDDLKQDALCVTEAALENFLRESSIIVQANQIKVLPVAQTAQAGKKCESRVFGIKTKCWKF